MANNKLTDNDIIKALECCANINDKDCTNCPYPDVKNKGSCVNDLRKDALDLINRQQAEIEQLTSQKMSREQDRDYWMAQTRIARDNIKFAKTGAIIEFANLIKRRLNSNTSRGAYLIDIIDNLVKEMTESVNYGSSKTEGVVK